LLSPRISRAPPPRGEEAQHRSSDSSIQLHTQQTPWSVLQDGQRATHSHQALEDPPRCSEEVAAASADPPPRRTPGEPGILRGIDRTPSTTSPSKGCTAPALRRWDPDGCSCSRSGESVRTPHLLHLGPDTRWFTAERFLRTRPPYVEEHWGPRVCSQVGLATGSADKVYRLVRGCLVARGGEHGHGF